MPEDIPPLGERQRLSRLYWRAVDPIANAIELAKRWLVDQLFGPFPESFQDSDYTLG